ncbi:MAG: AAA family ATPase, partial [Candidatus Lokiarchaeota archaeon]
RTVTIKLSSGFTCIVGPNGAGKSNIIDALTFALGRLSKKTMRAKSLEDLIFAGSRGKNPSQRAKVTLFFDNSEDIFPAPGDTFQVSRSIKRGGGGGYKINGKRTTRQQILNALATANIDPDGTNQFVLQGKIVELTHMNPENRRDFIEELIGLQKYDEMKDATMKELEKAERDLGQFEAIFKEVSSQLKKVEKEKNDALAWKELDEKIKFYNAQLIALKISKLKEEEESLQNSVEQSTKIIEEFEEKISRQEEILKQESLLMDNIQKTITEKEKERESINENITQLKTQLSSQQTSLNIANKTIDKYTKDITTLENKQMKLEQGQTYDSIITEINRKISETEKSIEDSKQEIETRQQNQADLDIKIKLKNEEQSTFKSDISNVKQKVSSDNAQIKVLKENIKKNEEKKVKLEEDLKKLKGEAESIEEAIRLTKGEEKTIREKIDKLKAGISKENQNQKDLENQIKELQDKQNDLNSNQMNFQSSLSSLTTEIKINKTRIRELEEKKKYIENKITELSEGKDTEVVLKELINKKSSLVNDLNQLKKEYQQESSTFRKYEQDLELLIMKQDSVESEIYDNKAKIDNLNTKLKLVRRDFT